MSANAAYTVIVIVVLAFVVTIITTVLVLNARDRSRAADRKAEKELAEMEWASKVHDLARRFLTLGGEDYSTTGRVLLDHAHLLRPGTRQCGCPAPEVKEPMRVGGKVVS